MAKIEPTYTTVAPVAVDITGKSAEEIQALLNTLATGAAQAASDKIAAESVILELNNQIADDDDVIAGLTEKVNNLDSQVSGANLKPQVTIGGILHQFTHDSFRWKGERVLVADIISNTKMLSELIAAKVGFLKPVTAAK